MQYFPELIAKRAKWGSKLKDTLNGRRKNKRGKKSVQEEGRSVRRYVFHQPVLVMREGLGKRKEGSPPKSAKAGFSSEGSMSGGKQRAFSTDDGTG